jgi:hypothetical protein
MSIDTEMYTCPDCEVIAVRGDHECPVSLTPEQAISSHIDWKKAQLEHWSGIAGRGYRPIVRMTREELQEKYGKAECLAPEFKYPAPVPMAPVDPDSTRDRISECLHAALSSLELAATLAGEAKLANVKGFIIDAKDMLNPLFDFLALERMTLERIATGGTK